LPFSAAVFPGRDPLHAFELPHKVGQVVVSGGRRNILAVSITAVIWLNLLQPYKGLINAAAHAVGIEQEIFWLNDGALVWPSIILVTFWWNTGYYMLIYLAGLQDIPAEQYEAAALDGASRFQRILWITIPSLKRTHLLILFCR